jgi:hypothetical protein
MNLELDRTGPVVHPRKQAKWGQSLLLKIDYGNHSFAKNEKIMVLTLYQFRRRLLTFCIAAFETYENDRRTDLTKLCEPII